MRIPVPDDATYDYLPIDGPNIGVGTSLLSLWTVQGEIVAVTASPSNPGNPDEFWSFLLSISNPDGSEAFGVALFPETPASMSDDWWGRLAIWKRAAKLAVGGTLTAPDGSKWIYPGDDGRVLCYAAGSSFAQGARLFRGQLTTDTRDLWVCDDADFDWIPVTAGSEVAEGDTITFLTAKAGVVASVVSERHEFYRRTEFKTDAPTSLGWFDEVRRSTPVPLLGNLWTFFDRLPKPAADTKLSAPDGSKWIYTGTSNYYCWSAGTTYPQGSIYRRGQITGGLRRLR